MFVACAFVLLCLVPLSHSAPVTCVDLVRPLAQVDLHHLEGRRVLVAGSLSYLPFMEDLKRRDSATASFSSNNSTTNISFKRSMLRDNKCHYASYNISLEGSSFTFDNGSVTTTFMHTSCHDCVLLSFDVESGKRLHFYLFSRRRQLEQEEIEDFRAQVKCQDMPPPVVMDPTKELCPEQPTSDPAAETEEETDGKKD
ncbi:alpha-1-acid glycoprotein 1-like protein [Lates japonicus]|uniref:Alpha-1-acid glycoprotein 1-like protein n=1 Tax=Lates japonicus TaxID=270547 RepID=A0AAD3REP8_LATJO|nr:alpha-1-acid glycoprotein 1-like protein [Lates japonicus]